ncbi:MAG: IS200/IS605 family transposase [Desulfovibrionaceae bacterium]|nr:IS200/IS605 family transposase [Desulfovibrionaceae bacterium]
MTPSIDTLVKAACTQSAYDDMEIKDEAQILAPSSRTVRLQVTEETPGVQGSFRRHQTILLRDIHAAYHSHQVHEYMIETEPLISMSTGINLLKSYTMYSIWKHHPEFLRRQFWKEKTFWTDGYFVCSVGNVSEETVKRYIENQGRVQVPNVSKRSNSESNLQKHSAACASSTTKDVGLSQRKI